MNNRFKTLGCVVILSAMLLTTGVLAQEIEIDSAASATTDTDLAKKLTDLETKLAAQEDKIKQLEASSKSQDAQMATLTEENRKTRDALAAAQQDREEISLQLVESITNDQDRFRVYGFMDVNYSMAFPQNENNILYASGPSKYSSFLMNNINLFFANQMNSFISALVEIRFTFSPLGDLTSVPNVIYVNGVEQYREGEFNRVSTRATNAFGASFNLGGIYIERAHFDVTPRDWFNVRGGRFLTPYGIWNEDHGATVSLTALMPFLQVFEYVPSAQTGLMAYGTMYPSDIFSLRYAVTLSNGRSPTDAYFDMDDNKAVGLRGKATLTGDDWSLALGGYGYFGEYTDSTKEVRVAMTPDGRLDPAYTPALTSAHITTENYWELIGAVDMEAIYKGLRLSGEFVWRKIDYRVPPRSPAMQAVFLDNDPLQETWQGDKIAMSGYGLLSYTLPLELKVTTITPFVGADFLYPDDATDYDSWIILQFGVNVKPGAFLTLKGSGYMINPTADQYGGHIWYVTGQAAVSF